MSDLVVTCPKTFWRQWIAEGDAAGDPPSGEEWAWFLGGRKPPIQKGDRLYVVAHGKLRGYAPVTRLVETNQGWAICREAGAVAVTVHFSIPGFRGWRYVWWRRDQEHAFPDWRTP